MHINNANKCIEVVFTNPSYIVYAIYMYIYKGILAYIYDDS